MTRWGDVRSILYLIALFCVYGSAAVFVVSKFHLFELFWRHQ